MGLLRGTPKSLGAFWLPIRKSCGRLQKIAMYVADMAGLCKLKCYGLCLDIFLDSSPGMR